MLFFIIQNESPNTIQDRLAKLELDNKLKKKLNVDCDLVCIFLK